MFRATRTTTVLRASIARSVTEAGAITERVASVVMDKPQGLIKAVLNIVEEIQRCDRERHEREERERHAREERERRAREERQQQERRAREQQEQRAREQQEQPVREQLQQRFREQVEQCSTPESNSGSSQTPQGNRNNLNNKPNYFDIFKNLLKEILDVVFGVERPRARVCISRIFRVQLTRAQKDYLGKIIERLYKGGILVEVLILVIRIFSEHFPEDISFRNFLSLTEFVAVYIQEEINYRTVVFRMDEKILRGNDSSIPEEESENLRAAIVSNIMNLADIVRRIVDIFVRLRFDIEIELKPFELPEIWSVTRNLSPNFRDVFSAIYHYFKHRCVDGDGVLSVRAYYDWIRRVLEELGRNQDYRNLLKDRSTQVANVKFEMYVPIFNRRIRTIVNTYRNTDRVIIMLASCYVLDNENGGDGEGMVWIKIHRY